MKSNRFVVCAAAVALSLIAVVAIGEEKALTSLFQEDEAGNLFFEGKPLDQHGQSLVKLHRLHLLLAPFSSRQEWHEEHPDQPANLAHAARFTQESDDQGERHLWVVLLWEPASQEEVVATIGEHLIEQTRQLVEAGESGSLTAAIVKQMEADETAIQNCVISVSSQ